MMIPDSSPKRRSYKITVAAGKGGVGKTNTASNLAVLLSSCGKRVLLFDADLGLASVDTLLNLAPDRNIQQVLRGECALKDILLTGPANISVLPAAPGIAEVAELNETAATCLHQQLAQLFTEYDFVIIDAPPGISTNVQRLAQLSDEVLLITTPEPTAVIDAYALAKVLSVRYPATPLRLLLNMVSVYDTGERVCAGFHQVVSRFLDRRIDTLGRMPLDSHVALAVRRQQPFALCYPDCPASRSLRAMSLKLLHGHYAAPAAAPQTLSTSVLFDHEATPGRNRVAGWLDPKVG